MNQNTSEVKIAIFGHYGNKNLGDEAIITAVIQNIRQRLPGAQLYGFSIDPDDTAKRYEIPAFRIRNSGRGGNGPGNESDSKDATKDAKRESALDKPANATGDSSVKNRPAKVSIKNTLKRIPLLGFVLRALAHTVYLSREFFDELGFLRRCYKLLKGIDVLIITGSNQFLDNFGGPGGFPYTLLKWSALAKLAGSKVIYMSVGAGPIGHRFSKVLFRLALVFSDYVSFRDEPSKRLIESTGFSKQSFIYPDLAYSLFMDDKLTDPEGGVRDGNKPIVGINPMPMYDRRYWCEKDDGKYSTYMGKLVKLATILLDSGYKVFFFATQAKDEYVIEDIMKKLGQETKDKYNLEELVKYSRTVYELMDVIASADIVVASRFHGTVLSLLAQKGVLGICYYRKADDLLKEMGQGDYSVELDTFEVEDVVNKFHKLEQNLDLEREKIRKTDEAYRLALDSQYHKLVELMLTGR